MKKLKKLNKIILISMFQFDYFRVSELFTHCSDEEICVCVKNHYIDTLLTLLMVLDSFRAFSCEPIILTSSFRSYEHNKRVGGSLTSQHLLGLAIDFKPSTMPMKTFVTYFRDFLDKSALSKYLGQIIIYDSFIHIGMRTSSHPKITIYDQRTSQKSH